MSNCTQVYKSRTLRERGLGFSRIKSFYQIMAKFIQTVATVTDRSENKKNIRSAFNGFKNPFASTNPFKDGETLKFEDIVPVSWTHEKYGSGQYLALKFEGKKDVLALTSFAKEVNGYGSLDTADTELKPFANSGGFAEWLSSQIWDESIIDKIYDWFDKPIKIKLTKYYLPQGSTRKTCSLTNIIKE